MKTIREFTQTSSIVRRLRVIILLMAVLLLVASLATWLSSRRYIEELQSLNQLNRITFLSTRSAQNVISLRETLEKMLQEPTGKSEEYRPAFEASRLVAIKALESSLELLSEQPKLKEILVDAQGSFALLDAASRRFLEQMPALTKEQKENAGKELLLVKQFELEFLDATRKARLEMVSMSDVLLERVYRNRYAPFLISSLLSLLFFVTALALGMSVTRRLKASIQSLLDVTDQVAEGNYAVAIPIRAHDEIGRLTYAFQRMLSNLKESMERTTHLQKITAEFSRALEPKEVADAVVAEGISILGASAGAVLRTDVRGGKFHFFRASGYSEETQEGWESISLDQDIPVAEALRAFRPYFPETRDEIFRNFPASINKTHYDVGSSMVIPLGEPKELAGVLTFRFEKERVFSEYERAFAIALGALASQAYKRASLYEDAQKAIEIRDSFLSIAAHELKTPLTSLKLQVQLGELQVAKISETPLSPEKLGKIFRVCHAQADRLNTLVDDLLDVGRIERGTIVYNFDKVNLRQLTDSVIERFGEALRLRNCTVEVTTPEPLIARADPFRIEQVLINLLSNSVKYGQEKPVRVQLGREDGKVYFSVIDQGMGIAFDKQSMIFDRFERAISSRNISGLGLGLYISRRIIEAHQGSITVHSALGEGSTFKVLLPAAS